jgi:hypothetical protein
MVQVCSLLSEYLNFHTFVHVFDTSANIMLKGHVALLREITIFYICSKKENSETLNFSFFKRDKYEKTYVHV